MKRYAFLILIAAAGCSPSYKSGKTQCSTDKQCPGGYSCKDDGTSATHYCFDNKTLGCPAAAGFYCSQSNTCWAKPGACSTYTSCPAGSKHPSGVICGSASYHADCNADQCVANGVVSDASVGAGGHDAGAGGVLGTGGATGKGGAGGTTTIIIIGSGGAPGTGGVLGTGGIKDASPDGIGGITGTGGIRDAGADGRGGVVGTGGLFGTGGATGRGGATGSGGIIGTGGTTTGSTLCSGTPYSCSLQTYAGDCATENGCTWNSSTSTCSGTPSSCNTYSTSTWCIYNNCDWAGAKTCASTPTTSYCSSLTVPTTDAGTPDLCTFCEYNSCCGQLTNCENDATGNCYNNYTGPLWNAWIDCLINCCGSSTYCGWY
jgi:hypothetical protein